LKAADEKSRTRIRNPVCGYKDPDPSQNVTDPEHGLKYIKMNSLRVFQLAKVNRSWLPFEVTLYLAKDGTVHTSEKVHMPAHLELSRVRYRVSLRRYQVLYLFIRRVLPVPLSELTFMHRPLLFIQRVLIYLLS
jgi:hypothetical protein